MTNACTDKSFEMDCRCVLCYVLSIIMLEILSVVYVLIKIGKILGGKQILLYKYVFQFQILGKGSFGVVIRGKWRQVDVAIKIFQTEQDYSAFSNELRQSSRVEHENIIKLYGASTNAPFIFLVMVKITIYSQIYFLGKIISSQLFVNS